VNCNPGLTEILHAMVVSRDGRIWATTLTSPEDAWLRKGEKCRAGLLARGGLEASEGDIASSCRVAAVALLIRSAKWQDLIKETEELPCKPKILWCTAAPWRWS